MGRKFWGWWWAYLYFKLWTRFEKIVNHTDATHNQSGHWQWRNETAKVSVWAPCPKIQHMISTVRRATNFKQQSTKLWFVRTCILPVRYAAYPWVTSVSRLSSKTLPTLSQCDQMPKVCNGTVTTCLCQVLPVAQPKAWWPLNAHSTADRSEYKIATYPLAILRHI